MGRSFDLGGAITTPKTGRGTLASMGWFRKLAFWRDDTLEDTVAHTVDDEIHGCFTLPESEAAAEAACDAEAEASKAPSTND